jgi:MIP family channel proteins
MQIDPLFRKALAEVVGIFCFFFAGIGAIVDIAGTDASSNLLVVAFAHGIMLAIMVSALGEVSGGHFNPAVTFGLFVGGMIDIRTVVVYWCAQLFGAVLAALAIEVAFPKKMYDPSHIGAAALAPGVNFGTGSFIEAVLTFFLVLAVYGTAVDPRHPPIGGLAIGLTVFVDILVGGGRTGAAMNPARAFGPALVSGHWNDQLVYWLGPLIGGAVAGLVYKNLFWQTPAETKGRPATSLAPGVVRTEK